MIVDNEAGVLARVIGLFSGRGYNIDSLTVAEIDHKGHRSRITIVTRGTEAVIDQIKAQLGRIVPVHEVIDLTVEGASVERELALLKVQATGDKRIESVITSYSIHYTKLYEILRNEYHVATPVTANPAALTVIGRIPSGICILSSS